MNIGIVDVDGHNFPNFALMKISAWHKLQGDNVEIALPMFGNYDRVYQSKIFTFTPDSADFDGKCEVVRGGTGYDIHSRLPECIEQSRQWIILYILNTLSRSNSFRAAVSADVRSASFMTKKVRYTRSNRSNSTPTENG